MVDVHRTGQGTNHDETGNEQALKSLMRAIALASGRRFSLILAHCNYSHLQQKLMQRLRAECSIELCELLLSPSAHTLYSAIEAEFEDQRLPALVVSGLEQVTHLDRLLLAANQFRDEFGKQTPYPIVLWVTDSVLAELVRLAPDFYSWAASPIKFRLSSDQLLSLLQAQAEQLFAYAFSSSLEPDPIVIFSNSQQALFQRTEINAALQELSAAGRDLTPDLNASLQFALAIDDVARQQLGQASDRYRDSLAYWQQTHQLERASVILFQLGLCALRQAEFDREQQPLHWARANDYLSQCLAACDVAERPDLKARFIGYRGEALKHLKQWDALQQLVEDASVLYQEYPNPIEQARVFGFQAEVLLSDRHQPEAARQYAQRALQQVEAVSQQQNYVGQYLLLLARSQHELGRINEGIQSLRQARRQTSPKIDPALYAQTLELLRVLYFKQKEYLVAFDFKREQLSVESQYGFRAFIGAGRLRPKRSAEAISVEEDTVAQEIAVSGRQQDVEQLIGRIARPDYKLTILHGQLGVGKSSLLQAGLKPSLDRTMIESRDITSILIRAYTNWISRLGEEVVHCFDCYQQSTQGSLASVDQIVEVLRTCEQQRLITVLIFDQFEEFFFIYQDRAEREVFFSFLSQCLNIPYVKVILSLREDYLHYLLEWERCSRLGLKRNSTLIHDDILSNKNRCELKNFSRDDAENIIQTLTERSQFHLEAELVTRLVQDLANERDEIRPIELQIIGAQLSEERIRTLEQYQQLGDNPKERLVQQYLDGVIRDCGPENEEAARLILYLLTGENDTRPPKTKEELETELKALEKGLIKEAEKLDIVLEIFRKSGLVFLIRELPADRYQLVHDYLVAFIRQQRPKIERLVRELEENRKKLNQAKMQLRIAELEKEASDERRRRTQADLALSQSSLKSERKRKRRMIFLASISTFFMISGYFIGLYRDSEQKFADSIAIQNGNILRIYVEHIDDLIRYKETERALMISLKAANSLESKYSDVWQAFRVKPESTSKDVIKVLHATVMEVADVEVTDKGYIPIDINNIDSLTSQQQLKLLDQLKSAGCAYALKDQLDPGSNICPDMSK